MRSFHVLTTGLAVTAVLSGGAAVASGVINKNGHEVNGHAAHGQATAALARARHTAAPSPVPSTTAPVTTVPSASTSTTTSALPVPASTSAATETSSATPVPEPTLTIKHGWATGKHHGWTKKGKPAKTPHTAKPSKAPTAHGSVTPAPAS